METITNIAGAASKAIWGGGPETQNSEPLSGETGNTKAGEPYDAGNLDSTTTDLAAASTSTSSSIGPVTDARDASSRTVDTSKNSTESGPASFVGIAGGATSAGSATYLSYRPSAAATTEPNEASKGATTSAPGTGHLSDAKMPAVGDSAQSLGDSHAVGAEGDAAPAVQEVKSLHGGLSADRGTKEAQRIHSAEKETAGASASGIGGGDSGGKTTVGGTGKGTGIATTGGATKSAGGAEGGAAEGEEHRSSGKFGAFKEKIKAKLHHKSDKS